MLLRTVKGIVWLGVMDLNHRLRLQRPRSYLAKRTPNILVRPTRVERAFQVFSLALSPDQIQRRTMAVSAEFESAIFSVTGRRGRPDSPTTPNLGLATGIEPACLSVRSGALIQLSYASIKNGEDDGIRTRDTRGDLSHLSTSSKMVATWCARPDSNWG